jgi:hypothetical protein
MRLRQRSKDDVSTGAAEQRTAHVEADHGGLGAVVGVRQRLDELRFADAGGAGKQQRGDRPAAAGQAGARAPHGARHGAHRGRLAHHARRQRRLEAQQRVGVTDRQLCHRHAADPRHHLRHVVRRHLRRERYSRGVCSNARGARQRRGAQLQQRAGFVHHVDGLVGQEAVVDVAHGQSYGLVQRIRCVTHLVVCLIRGCQAAEDGARGGGRRLGHQHGLEAPLQRRILLDVPSAIRKRQS